MEQQNKYTHEEVLQASMEYFKNDILAASSVQKKYLLRDKEGNFLEKTPKDMHIRLAKEFTRIEASKNPTLNKSEYYDKVYSLLDDFAKVVPQGSPMSGIGNTHQLQSLSNCFVIPSPEDSLSSIFAMGNNMAQIHKRRGGVGVDLSKFTVTHWMQIKPPKEDTK